MDYNSIANDNPTLNKKHKIRLSIDIRTIKDYQFKGLVYAKYSAHKDLNITHFKTSPALELNNPRVEESFKNSF